VDRATLVHCTIAFGNLIERERPRTRAEKKWNGKTQVVAKPAPGLSWSTEEQDVAVRIADLEAAKTIVGMLERHTECCSMIGKFDSERVRVRCIDEGVPPHGRIALWVRQRRRVFVGFDEDLRSVSTHDGEKRILIRLLKSCLKAKLIAIKSDGFIDVADDEER
jgi:hypothetical protein